MPQTSHYNRKHILKRGKEIIKLPTSGSFNQVKYVDSEPTEIIISNYRFKSIHRVVGPSGREIFKALKCEELPEVLFTMWSDYPYLSQIEEGGDTMLQELYNHKEIKYLLIDNTFVKSGWMSESVTKYLNEAWYPGLLELGLQGFAHLQAESVLGASSFEKFEEDVNQAMATLAQSLLFNPFQYIPIKTIENDTAWEEKTKSYHEKALEKGLSSLLNIKQETVV